MAEVDALGEGLDNYINRLMRDQAALADLLDLQAATTRGVPPKDPRTTLVRQAAVADLLDLQAATARGIPPKRARLVAHPLAEIGDLRWPTQAEDPELRRLEIAFNGAMVLDADPLKISANHFADLQNLRYGDVGLEGVRGYSKINTVALADPALRSGIHFIKTINGVTASHVLVQAWNAGLTASAVYLNTTPIGTQGNFSATPLTTDPAGAALGRFALGPDGMVLYCNESQAMLWGSAEHRAGAVINYDDPAAVFRYDITERMQNNLSDVSNRFTLVRDAANDIWLLIGSTRPLQGIKFYVQTVNAGASTSTVEYWNGSAWTAVAGFADGTAVGGVTLAQTGSMTFTSTVSTARIRLEDERLLYFYRVRAGATGTPDATIQIYHVTVDAPMQSIVDIWDGVHRKPVFASQGGVDYTLEVQDPSSSDAPLAMDVGGGLGATVIFEDRMTAFKIRMVGSAVNSNAATLTVNYWNGTGFVSVGTLRDGTLTGGATFGRSGTISWNAPSPLTEQIKTGEEAAFVGAGIRGYAYFLTASAGLSASVLVDVVEGIPAQRFSPEITIPGYRFPFFYQDRAMIACRLGSNDGNRIDYSGIGTPDVWNGVDSSDQGKEIYVGGTEPLIAGIELSNRFVGLTNAVTSTFALLFKQRETWLLRGTTPETFQLFPISLTIGCPAPLTLATATISIGGEAETARSVAIWVSAAGPMLFDGTTLTKLSFKQPDGAISSIDPYFDVNDSRETTGTAFLNARAWLDQYEYNVLLPTGGSTTCNVWLVCDLYRKKWYRKVPTTYPQMGFALVDIYGRLAIYGGLDTGFMMALESGLTWDGAGIAHVVRTADILPSASMWDTTRLRYVKLGLVRETGIAAVLSIAHAPNGTEVFTAQATLDVVGGTARWRKVTQALNLEAWSHQLELTLTTSDKGGAPRLLGLGLLYETVREEMT